MHDERERSGERARVWLVDDSPLEAEIARRVLEEHDVAVFLDANSMLERLAAGDQPDLVLLDWNMPQLSGVDACRFLRKRANRVELPIVFLTASQRREDLEEGLAAGANDFIRKPFEPAELRARVTSLLDVRSLHQRCSLAEGNLRHEASFREQFLAILAHDLRQPLNVFAIGSSVLAAAATTQMVRDEVRNKMAGAASRMQRMIGELLDFSRSRPEHGIPITLAPVDLGSVAQAVVEEIRLGNPNRRIELTVVGPTEGIWDSDRLAQVVSNLVENALANSPSESVVALTISAKDGRIALVVENTGPTIAPEVLPTIFEAFRRRTKLGRTGGLGLGLYIVQQIVLAHGGTVRADSAGGRTRFEVSLPRSAPPPA